jgi:ABC-2 type transport system ATP-binding protein
MVGRLYHLSKKEALSRAEDILERLELAYAGDKTVKTYSGGMRRRLDLGASLIGRPKILFLDEPTTGLDPRSRLGLWDIIRELIKDGTSILLTTQYLEEADTLAKRIAVIDRGKVIAEGTSNQLKSKLGGDMVELEFKTADSVGKAIEMLKTFSKKPPIVDSDGVTVRVPVHDGSKSLLGVVRELDKTKLEPVSVALHRPSLDDVFLSLTGSKASDVAKNETKRTKK